MTHTHLTGTIVGGPHDGGRFAFEGTSEKSEVDVLRMAAYVKLGDHKYRIVELDAEKRTAVLLW